MRKVFGLAAIVAVSLAASSAGAVSNGSFDSGIYDTPHTGDYYTAATDWGSSSPSRNTTELLGSFAGRSGVLHVTTLDGGAGIYQYPVADGDYGWADVYVASGSVYFWTCNSFCNYPSGAFYSATTSEASWVRLSVEALTTFIDEVGIYSSGGAADFYVDLVAVDNTPPPVPEPASWVMMLGGFGLLGSALRRRRAGAATA